MLRLNDEKRVWKSYKNLIYGPFCLSDIFGHLTFWTFCACGESEKKLYSRQSGCKIVKKSEMKLEPMSFKSSCKCFFRSFHAVGSLLEKKSFFTIQICMGPNE
jgi:hypothetical protein